MENMLVSAKVLIFKRYVLFMNSYIVFGMLLSTFLFWYFHALFILWTGCAIFLLLPIIGKRYLMTRFSRQTIFEFSDESIVISYDGQSLKENCKHEIRFQNVLKYKYEEGYGNPYLVLYFKNGKKKSFNFEYKSPGEAHVLDYFLNYIKNYNIVYGQDTISIQPTFMATKNGLFFLMVLGIGWVSLCILTGINHIKLLPLPIIGGLAMFMQTIHLRSIALKSYKTQQN